MHSVHSTDSAEPMLQNTPSEPDPEPLLQSTAGINLIFVNIDWKKDRQESDAASKRNRRLLDRTITSIVKEMKPAVICCCEVGQVRQPMTPPQIDEIMQTFRDAWRDDISFLYEAGEPYLTAWDGNLCRCKHGRILRNLYKATIDGTFFCHAQRKLSYAQGLAKLTT